MKEKIKSKYLDTIATFVGSFMALFFYNKSAPYLISFINNYSWSENNEELVKSFILSLFIAIGYILVLLIFWLFTSLFSTVLAPKVEVAFLNIRNNNIQELNLGDNPEEPYYLKIEFKAKFSKIQLWILKNLLKARIFISSNPTMVSFDLAEGFIASDKDFKLHNQCVYFDLFSKFSSSTKSATINVELNLLLVQSATGDLKFNLDVSNAPFLLKNIFSNYCKFKIEKFIILG
ncbi:hypothetical protein SAMN04488100_13129 [Alkalibacterium putridalgicola]|uniref:Uncharacterized protein n=1 Tax=Alkalibacterium putridalgicola TaxID=426703 RepID=A0A1H7W7G7_9LACT|nr:hypothetical protein [Alkalibacterium putridalgicola]GEK89986.1 hypothetical protein APU01nite_20250 [Alkalibacterium putridalgicola]SEM17486.1 hypothetical protein SAMN04488100_13129 [Alkalibacterium putridalgicola]